MLERLRALGRQRSEAGDPDSFQGAPTTVEPLPPADALVDDELRPTIKEIPVEMRNLVRGSADRAVRGTTTTERPVEGVTSKLERVTIESTPAPLPPSPEAEQAAASWFESVPTSPAVSSTMDPFRPGTESNVGSVITPVRQRAGAQLNIPATAAYARPAHPGQSAALADRPWAIPMLIAATSLTVGMILGALIFGGGDAPAPAASRDAGVCTPCPAAADSGPPPGDGLAD